jgi:hypothetical protein
MDHTNAPLLDREPVRVYAIAAGLLTAVSSYLTSIGQGISHTMAAGVALGQLALVVGGGEAARSKAYAPVTYDRDIDAHVIIEDPADR